MRRCAVEPGTVEVGRCPAGSQPQLLGAGPEGQAGLPETAVALIFKSEDALAPLLQGVVLPLLLLSGILLPMSVAPGWLKFLSSINPLTHAANAARAVFNGQWGDPEILLGVGLTGILAVIAVWIASRAFSQANA